MWHEARSGPASSTSADPASPAWRKAGRAYFDAREETLRLTRPVAADATSLCAGPGARSIMWHLAHTSRYVEEHFLEPLSATPARRDPAVDTLFGDRTEIAFAARQVLAVRPGLDEILAYRARVDECVRALLEAEASWEGSGRLATRLRNVVDHERHHQERLLVDLKRLLAAGPRSVGYGQMKTQPVCAVRSHEWIEVEAPDADDSPRVSKAKPTGGEGRASASTRRFGFGSRLIRNAEYLVFVRDGGYARSELWSAAGLACVRANGWRAPAYWHMRDDDVWTVTFAGRRPLRMDEPVCHVSLHEAQAFARWAGARLPTDAEWGGAAQGLPLEGNLLESGLLHPAPAQPSGPVDAQHPPPLQIYGDLWEWTTTAQPPPPPPETDDSPELEWRSGHHLEGALMLRGGSCATSRSHLGAYARYGLPPWARVEFVGIRLATDL